MGITFTDEERLRISAAAHEAAELIANCYCDEDDTFVPEAKEIAEGIIALVERRASPSPAEIVAEMAREAAMNQAKFESGMGTEQELDIAERYKAVNAALREAERRIRDAG